MSIYVTTRLDIAGDWGERTLNRYGVDIVKAR